MQMFHCFLFHCPLQTEIAFCNSRLTVFHSPSLCVVSRRAGLDLYNVVLCTDSSSLPPHCAISLCPVSIADVDSESQKACVPLLGQETLVRMKTSVNFS